MALDSLCLSSLMIVVCLSCMSQAAHTFLCSNSQKKADKNRVEDAVVWAIRLYAISDPLHFCRPTTGSMQDQQG